MDRFTVKIKVKQYNVGVPPQTMYMTYICKNVVGGLSELETTLQYDEEWAGFQYSYSETTLRFCKEDKDFLLKYLFGQNFWQGGVLSQDYSFSIDYLPDVEIVDNYTNTPFIKAKLDINTLKVIPPYIEATLIDNATLKNDIEKKVSFSFEELNNAGLVKPILADLYQGNPITEHVVLYGTSLPDMTWGLQEQRVETKAFHYGHNWIPYPYWAGSVAELAHPIIVQGEGEVYAQGERWGQIGGYADLQYNTYPVFAGIQPLPNGAAQPLQSYSTTVGGFTVPAGSNRQIDMTINFHLGRLQVLRQFYYKNKKWWTAYLPFSFGDMEIYVRLTKEPIIDPNFYQDIKIAHIAREQQFDGGTYHKWWEPAAHTYELYNLNDYQFIFNIPASLDNFVIHGTFYMKATNKIQASTLTEDFTRLISGNTEDVMWKSVLSDYSDGNNLYDIGHGAAAIATNPYVLNWQADNDFHINTGDNSQPLCDYSFKCEVNVSGIANSKAMKRNDLFGVPLLNLLQFVGNKAGVNIDVSQYTSQGVNDILFANEKMVNFTQQMNEKGQEYLATQETLSIRDILDWINKQFFVTIYYYNNKLIIKSRLSFYLANILSTPLQVEVNRLMELSVVQPPKQLKLGSREYNVNFYYNKEHFNMPAVFEVQNENTGETADFECGICTNPQFIDWLLVSKNINGSEQCLIETKVDGNGDYQLYAYATEQIKALKEQGYSGAEGYPTLQNWQQRHWLNIYLSPLAQFARWRRVFFPLAHDRLYKLIENENTHINIIDNLTTSHVYQHFYKNAQSETLGLWNNSAATIQGLTAVNPTSLHNEDKNNSTALSPLRLKIETPIYKEFVGNVPQQAITFTYNGVTVKGLPTEIKTYFDRKVQEFDVIVLRPLFTISDLMN